MEIAGYLFNGKFYKSLDDLIGRTMSDDNQPEPLYRQASPPSMPDDWEDTCIRMFSVIQSPHVLYDNYKQGFKDCRYWMRSQTQSLQHSMPDDDAIYKEQQKLPYTKHLDDGQFNDGQQSGFEIGAKWMRSQCDGLIKQKAVEFAEWASGKGWKYIPEKELWQLAFYTGHYKTTEELYEIFNQQER